MPLPKTFPHVPPLFFIRQYATGERRTLIGLWILVGLVAAAALVAYAAPFALGTQFTSQAEPNLVPIVLENVENNHREMTLVATAAHVFVTSRAELLTLNGTVLLLFAWVISLAWGAFLTGLSHVKGNAGFVGFIPMGAFLFLGEHATLLFGVDPFKLLTLALVLAFMLPLFLLKENLWRLSNPARFLFFSGLALCLALGGWLRGAAGLHQAVVGPIGVWMLVVAFGGVYFAKNLPHAIVLWGTNAKQKRHRLSAPQLVAILALYVCFTGYLFFAHNGYWGLAVLPVRPIHLVVLGALLAPVVDQAAFHRLRNWLPSPWAFTLLSVALGLATFAVLGYGFAHGEQTLLLNVDRWFASALFALGLSFGAYVVINFEAPLKQRRNFYYVLYVTQRFPYWVMWVYGGTMLVIYEYANKQPGMYAAQAVIHNTIGDRALATGDLTTARTHYDKASTFVIGDPKAYYNAGMLFGLDPKAAANDTFRNRAVNYLHNAEIRGPFPPARLNAANFLHAYGQTGGAIGLLRKHLAANEPVELWITLAGLYLALNDPDEAILALKTANRVAPANGLVLANLGQIYSTRGHPEIAKRLLDAAQTLAPDDPFVRANAHYHALRHGIGRGKLPPALPDTLNYAYWLNRGLLAVRNQEAQAAGEAARRVGQLDPGEERLATAYLRLLAWQVADSIDFVVSRLDFANRKGTEIGLYANHNLGVFYHQKGLPNAAAPYFQLATGHAYEPEKSLEKLNTAFMELAAGRLALGQQLLEEIVAEGAAEARQPAQRELDLLAFANRATDLQTSSRGEWTFDECMRAARYCGHRNDLTQAALALQSAVAADSSRPEPYALLARLALYPAETRDIAYARIQTQAGEEKLGSKEPLIQLALAEIELLDGHLQAAQQTLKGISAGLPERNVIEARLDTARGNWEAADARLRKALKANPYNQPALVMLLRVGVRQQDLTVLQVVDPALPHYRRDPEIWAVLAKLYLQGNRFSDARHAAEEAIALAYSTQMAAELQPLLEEILVAETNFTAQVNAIETR